MSISWGYSPKVEKYIPLGSFPIDSYLLVAKQAIENLKWNVSHISEKGIIAYTPISFQSYSEEVSIRFEANFAIVKSECIGIQLLFNDYGKNELNLEKFFHEFEYVEFHLKEIWDESLAKLRAFVSTQDPHYFEKAPLIIKDKIKHVFHIFVPRAGYLVTPILLYLTIIYFLIYWLIGKSTILVGFQYEAQIDQLQFLWGRIFSNSRDFVFRGQVWRLITYQFVHLNYLHLFFNMYSLVYLGLMIEHKLKSKNFLFIYLSSGFCGGLASIMVHDEGFALGASGAIMGVFGAFLALLACRSFEKHATKALFMSTSIMVAFVLVNGISQGIDNAAHIGGLVSGFILTYILVSEKLGNFYMRARLRRLIMAALIAMFTASVFLFTPQFQSSRFEELVDAFEENSVGYEKVYHIPSDLSKLQKMKWVREFGMDLWERNAYIVSSMQALKLDEKRQKITEHYAKVTALTQRLEYIRYQFVKSKKPEAKLRLEEIQKELTVVKANAKEDVGLEFPKP